MSVINTNVKSLVAQQSLGVNERNMKTTMERLSTGNRINSAKDDAAGLAISNRMDSQVRGLNMAIRNANDGVSLMQTAEGAMQEVTTMLQRMRELAVQAVNGVNNDADRAALNAEVQQLKAEVDRVAVTTTFNNETLLNGSYGQRDLQIGHQMGQTLAVGMADMRTTALGSDSAAALTAFGLNAANDGALETAGDLGTGNVVINGVAVGSTSDADDTLSMDAKSASAIAKVAAINRVSEQTGVQATVGQTVLEGSSMTTPAALTGTVTINGVATASVTTTTDAGVSRGLIVDAVNAISEQTGVRAVNTGSDTGGVQLVADDGRNITLAFATLTDAATGLGTAAVQSGTYNLTSLDGEAITISSETAAPTDLAKAGLSAGSFSNAEATFTTKARSTVGAAAAPTNANAGVLEFGDLSINGVTIAAAVTADDTASNTSVDSSTKAASAIAIAAAINKSADETGVSAKANANVIVGTGFTAGSTTLQLNGVEISISAGLTQEGVATRINEFAGQTGVVAADNGVGLTYTAEDGRNISMKLSTDPGTTETGVAANIGLTNEGTNVDVSNAAFGAAVGTTTYASVTLTSASAFTIDRASNANTNLNALGFAAGTFGGDGEGVRVADLSVDSEAAATQAIGALDLAISAVSDARADLGAKQNRLEYTMDNLSTIVTNTSESQSRIRDTDYAVETTNLARAQIIQQAATAMLAQANQQPSSVLALLQ